MGANDLAVIGQQPGIDRLAPPAGVEHVFQFPLAHLAPRRPVSLGVCGFEQLGTEGDTIGHGQRLPLIGANVQREILQIEGRSNAHAEHHLATTDRPSRVRVAPIKTSFPYTIAPVVQVNGPWRG